MQTQHLLAGAEKSDEALLSAVREGDVDQFGLLYERYYGMARAIAFKHTSNASRVDDVVSESFARILQALKNGKGPHSYMGGYLSTTIAHLSGEYGMLAARELPSEQQHLEAMGTLDETVVKLHDSDEVVTAFTSLPERWQTVLWMTEIESKKPREVATAMSLSPNAVSALAVRAKESLREGFLRAHQNSPATAECNRFHSFISPYVRGSLSQKRSDALRSHMETCKHCTSEYLSLVGINKAMRSWIFPVLAGLGLWSTDGAAIFASAHAATAQPVGFSHSVPAAAGGSSSGVVLLSPVTWGTGAQVIAGAAAAAVAVVAVVGGSALVGHNDGVEQAQAEDQAVSAQGEDEKPSRLGEEFSATSKNSENSVEKESVQQAQGSENSSAPNGLGSGSSSDGSAGESDTSGSSDRGFTAVSAAARAATAAASGAENSSIRSAFYGDDSSNYQSVIEGSASGSSNASSAVGGNSAAQSALANSALGRVLGLNGSGVTADQASANSTTVAPLMPVPTSVSSDPTNVPVLSEAPQPSATPESATADASQSAEPSPSVESSSEAPQESATPSPSPTKGEVLVADGKGTTTPTDPVAPETEEPITEGDIEVSAGAEPSPTGETSAPAEPTASPEPSSSESATPTESPSESAPAPSASETPSATAEPSPSASEEPTADASPTDTATDAPVESDLIDSPEFLEWFNSVAWEDFDKTSSQAPNNLQCFVTYEDSAGSTVYELMYLPESFLGSRYTNYVLAEIYGWQSVTSIEDCWAV